MSLYDDGDDVEESPEVATPPEGSGDPETGGDGGESVGPAEAAEAAEAVEADDGSGGGLLTVVVGAGLLVFGLLVGDDGQQQVNWP